MGLQPENSISHTRRSAKRPTRIVSFADARSKADTADMEKRRAKRPSVHSSRPPRKAVSASHQRRPSIQRKDQKPSPAIKSSEQDAEQQEQNEAPKSKLDMLREKIEKMKHDRNKAKADAAFDRTYDDSKSSAAANATPEGSTPRAALYEGKMGSSHKKASKLQKPSRSSRPKAPTGKGGALKGSGLAAAVSTTGGKLQGAMSALGGVTEIAKGPAAKVANLKENPSLFKAVLALACVLFIVIMLYGPAQQYYCQMRETDRIEAEYAAVAARNMTLAEDIHLLSTDEGIADKAHADLGYVKDGEQTGVVNGLKIEDYGNFQGNVAPGSVPAPDTWYSPVFDIVFGYAFQ